MEVSSSTHLCNLVVLRRSVQLEGCSFLDCRHLGHVRDCLIQLGLKEGLVETLNIGAFAGGKISVASGKKESESRTST